MAPLATGAFLFGPALNEPFHSPVMSNWYTVTNSASFSVRHKTERFHWAHGINFAKLPKLLRRKGRIFDSSQ